jgi:D-alanyl-lipoteichoic acid acyltransferase DltB (MBOAT superfamily)
VLETPGTYYAAGLFWLALVLAIGVTWIAGERAVRTRAIVVSALSLIVWHEVAAVAVHSMVLLLGGVAWAYFCTRWLAGTAESRPNLTAIACAGPILLAWGIGRFVNAGSSLSVLTFAGFSFFVVKLFTVSKDIADGAVEKAAPLSLAAYLLFFPCAPSGPMHSFGEFDETLRKPTPPSGSDFIAAIFRLMLGFAKVKIVAPLLSPMSLAAFSSWDALSAASPTEFSIACVLYSFVLYLDFSGYSDLAIASAALVGLRVPENFRAPYLAQNIREFWQRWHITFTRVLTGYLFTPLSRWLQQRGLGTRSVMVIAYLVTFGFCGLWHGARWNMLAWGGYHAVGLIAYDLMRAKAAPRGRGARAAAAPAWKRALATAVTFGFVSLGWSLFAVPFTR